MSDEKCKVLLVEDNPVNNKLIERLLFPSKKPIIKDQFIFNLTFANTLNEAIAKLDQEKFDVILLDLMLPDSEGLNTLIKIKKYALKTPIVVQTGSNDENLMVKCFQLGVHGYLRKTNIDRNILVYAIQLAIQRQKYIDNLEINEQQKQQELEIQGLEQFSNSSSTNITARMFGSQPIQESIPDIFQELVEDYGKLLDLALEERAYRVDHNRVETLRSLAEKLGFLKATPRDVVAIHTQSLKIKNKNVLPAKSQAYIAEGRLMVLELMGYLTSYYRKYYIGLSNININ
jgi:CheY-like chemotaxis protein